MTENNNTNPVDNQVNPEQKQNEQTEQKDEFKLKQMPNKPLLKGFYRSIIIHVSLIVIVLFIDITYYIYKKFFHNTKVNLNEKIQVNTISVAEYNSLQQQMQKLKNKSYLKSNHKKEQQTETDKQNIKPKKKIKKKQKYSERIAKSEEKNDDINEKSTVKDNYNTKKVEMEAKNTPPEEEFDNFFLGNDDVKIDSISNSSGNNFVTPSGTILSYDKMIQYQIQKCWNNFFNIDAFRAKLSISLTIHYDMTGNIIGISEENQNSEHYNTKLYNQMLKDVKTALRDCSPLRKLPIYRYDEWKEVRYTFRYSRQ